MNLRTKTQFFEILTEVAHWRQIVQSLKAGRSLNSVID